jgi:uncharacterized protein
MGDEDESKNESLSVADNRQAEQFEVALNGELAFLAYERAGDRLVLIHTEVPPNLEGHGIGRLLVRAALDEAARDGEMIVPLCPFVLSYLRRHPEELNVVAPEYRAELQAR